MTHVSDLHTTLPEPGVGGLIEGDRVSHHLRMIFLLPNDLLEPGTLLRIVVETLSQKSDQCLNRGWEMNKGRRRTFHLSNDSTFSAFHSIMPSW